MMNTEQTWKERERRPLIVSERRRVTGHKTREREREVRPQNRDQWREGDADKRLTYREGGTENNRPAWLKKCKIKERERNSG